jgi:hypothetical protein
MANKEIQKSKYQRFIVEEIARSEIKNAEYNPRIIDEEARKKLKKNLAAHGLVETIVWNKRTGNLVSGHQRLSALDALERNKDYKLDVSVIDVDPHEEKVLNVQMNNPSMQGDWDLDALVSLNLDDGIDFGEMGFSSTDVDFLLDGDDRFSELMDTPEVDEQKNTLEDIKNAREEGNERLADRNNIDFYTVLVFKDEAEKKEFYKKINTPLSEEYLSVVQINRLVK